MSNSVAIVIGLILLVVNAFFVGAEFAVLSARRSSIEPLAAAGNKRAQTVLWAMEHVSLMLAACQLGVTACSVALGTLAEPAIARSLMPVLEFLRIPDTLTHPIAFVISLVIVVYLHVVVGEMIPKNLSVSQPERLVLALGPPLVWIARFLSPVLKALDWIANHVVRWSGVTPRGEVESTFTAEQVQSIVKHSQAEGILRDEQGLLTGAIEFSERTAGDVMVPLDKLVTLHAGFTPAELEREVVRTGYSRFPIVERSESMNNTTSDGQDNQTEQSSQQPHKVIGYIHLKDILTVTPERRDEPLGKHKYRPLAVSVTDDEVEESLVAMQHSGAHLARVLHQDQMVGVVFLEDIIEELVGEVRDQILRDNWNLQ